MKSKTDDLILILGPCVIEGEDHAVRTATIRDASTDGPTTSFKVEIEP